MLTLKFKAQPTNAFFATVDQMFGCSSHLPTTAEHAVQIFVHSSDNETVLGISRKLGGPAEHLMVAKSAFIGRPLNVRVHMLLKSAVRAGKLA